MKESVFLKICSQVLFDLEPFNVGDGNNGLALTSWQAIIHTNADLARVQDYVSGVQPQWVNYLAEWLVVYHLCWDYSLGPFSFRVYI